MREEQATSIARAWQDRAGRAPVGDWWTITNRPYGNPEDAGVAFGRELERLLPDLDAWAIIDMDDSAPRLLGLRSETLYEADVSSIDDGRMEVAVRVAVVDVAQLSVTRSTWLLGDPFEDRRSSTWTVELGSGRTLCLDGTMTGDGPADDPERLGWAFASLAGWSRPSDGSDRPTVEVIA